MTSLRKWKYWKVAASLKTFPPVALQSFRTLAALHIGGFFSYLDIWYYSLDEWSARRRASTYTGQHNKDRRGQTSMPWAGFEPTILATNRPRPTPQTARPLWPALWSITAGKLDHLYWDSNPGQFSGLWTFLNLFLIWRHKHAKLGKLVDLFSCYERTYMQTYPQCQFYVFDNECLYCTVKMYSGSSRLESHKNEECILPGLPICMTVEDRSHIT
jgi:hypothetical protein